MKDTLIERVNVALAWRKFPERLYSGYVRTFIRNKYNANPSGRDLKEALCKCGYTPSGKLGVYIRLKQAEGKPPVPKAAPIKREVKPAQAAPVHNLLFNGKEGSAVFVVPKLDDPTDDPWLRARKLAMELLIWQYEGEA